jgi:hypothetical protein
MKTTRDKNKDKTKVIKKREGRAIKNKTGKRGNL